MNREPKYAVGGKISPPSYAVPEIITAGQPLFFKPGQEPCPAETVYSIKKQIGAFEVALTAIIDTLRPVAQAYIDAGKWLMKTLANAGVTTDDLREQQAIKHGRRYWEDSKHRVRRTPGHPPLIDNGKAKR